jgi:hypothetical protein
MRLPSSAQRITLLLAAVLAALLFLVPPVHHGDAAEYAVTTIALAAHGTPAIRPDDIIQAKRLLPSYQGVYNILEQDMRENKAKVYPAFARGRKGDVYAIHFFAYSALAVLPYKLLELAGQDPLKCFQVVNLAAVFVLFLALARLFGSHVRALLGVALFMLCGGALYLAWSSPECLSAAFLLAALALYTSGAPIAGSMLAGVAAQQNPTILAFFVFAPLLDLCLAWNDGARLERALQRPKLLGLAAGATLFALPLLFNLWQFGVPNIIARLFSDASLIGPERLLSFYFDLNQGLAIGIPGVLAALVWWSWRRQGAVLALCTLMTLALALPALAVLNWNSGAQGVMRYAFWVAMPLVFTLLLRLRGLAHWPLPLMAALALAQGAAMASALSYTYVQFSPLASLVLEHAPGIYHPEPEIFAERAGQHDNYLELEKIYAYAHAGSVVKILYNVRQPHIEEQLCGSEGALAAGNRYVESTRGWRYIDGPLRCVSGQLAQHSFQAEQFKADGAVHLADGWNGIEMNGGAWNGAWSNGPRSRITVKGEALAQARSLAILGFYMQGNTRTRVRLNGVDAGWRALDKLERMPLPPLAPGTALVIELEHEAPHRADPRAQGLFLREITLQGGAP